MAPSSWRRKAKPYLYGVAPCLGGYAFGYDTGSISGILTEPQFNAFFNYPSNSLQGGITASIQAGAFVGSLLTGLLLSDRLGRRRTLIAGAALFTIGIAITTAANNVACLIAGRILNGMANGCTAMLVPLWQSEVTPKEVRGRVISLQQCVINFGILSSFLIQYGCSFIDSNAAWRIPLGLQMIPTIALFTIMFFLPESPRWLMSRGREREALAVLARVHADGDEHDPYVAAEFEEIREKIEWERTVEKPSYFALLFSKKHARRTYIGIGAQFWQQACGINSILYYAPFIFQQAGLQSSSASLLANVINGVVLNVVTLPNMYYLDTWGRRIPMIFGAFGMGICMLLVGVLLRTTGNPYYDASSHKVNFSFDNNESAARAVLAFLYLYVACFAISWATPAWVIPAEVFSLNTRARANSLTTATNWFVNFWFALYIPTALNNISWKLYIIFAAICVAAGISTWAFQVETANRSLEEMDELFRPEKTMWVFLDRDLSGIHPRRDARALEELKEKGLQRVEEVEDVGEEAAVEVRVKDPRIKEGMSRRSVEEA